MAPTQPRSSILDRVFDGYLRVGAMFTRDGILFEWDNPSLLTPLSPAA